MFDLIQEMEWNYGKTGFEIIKESISEEKLQGVRDSLTVKPFKCKGFGVDTDSSYSVYHEDESKIFVPKFWASQYFNIQPSPATLDAEFIIKEGCFEGSLRPFQEEIVGTVLPKIKVDGGGILSAQCGQGKTVMAINIICQLRVKTLIVVNKQALLSQWKERIAFFAPSLRVGTIQQSKIDIEEKDVVLGMLQSLSMKDYNDSVYRCFDFLVVDEVHNIATKTFSKMLLKVCPPMTLGLSATPTRPDGTSKVFHWFLGPILYRSSLKDASTRQQVDVRIVNYSQAPTYKFRELKNVKGDPLLSTMISNISELEERSRRIVCTVFDILKKSPTRSILILSSRIQQLRQLKECLDLELRSLLPLSIKTSLYVGSMKPAELQDALIDSQVLFGSYELICEGFDYPRLNTLIFATPRSRIEQAVGRILRKPDPDNPPLVIDFVDDLPSFKAQGLKRIKFYKTMGYKIMYEKSSP